MVKLVLIGMITIETSNAMNQIGQIPILIGEIYFINTILRYYQKDKSYDVSTFANMCWQKQYLFSPTTY